jgi:hypothetical protein
MLDRENPEQSFVERNLLGSGLFDWNVASKQAEKEYGKIHTKTGKRTSRGS